MRNRINSGPVFGHDHRETGYASKNWYFLNELYPLRMTEKPETNYFFVTPILPSLMFGIGS